MTKPKRRTTLAPVVKDAMLAIRIPSRLKRALEKRARDEGRSMANVVQRILEEALED